MVDIKISELTPATFATFADTHVIVQGGQTLKIANNLQADLFAAMLQDNDGISWSYNSLLNTITPSFILTASASDIPIEVIGTPAYTNVQHYINLFTSPGTISGGTITDAGGGNINVAAGTGVIRVADDNISTIKIFDWVASNGIAIPVDSVRYIGVEYNGGAPQVAVHTLDDWDYDTEFPLGKVVHENGLLSISNTPWVTADTIANIIERFDSITGVARDNRVGGLIISNTGTRNFAMTAGALLARLSEFEVSALDTSIAGNFATYHRNGVGGWTRTAAQTQWDNTSYDDGDGTLGALTTDFYTSRWFYVTLSGAVAMVYGQAQYATVGELIDSDLPPVLLPNALVHTGLLLGRFIVQEGENLPVSISTSFDSGLSASITDHGQLSGLLDDDHTQYHNNTRALAWLDTITFISSQQAITSAGTLTLPHGLGVAPKFWDCHLVNITAQHGYTAGQIVNPNFGSDTGTNRGVSIRPDATNLNIRFGSATGVFDIIHATAGTTENITNANWRVVFKARL